MEPFFFAVEPFFEVVVPFRLAVVVVFFLAAGVVVVWATITLNGNTANVAMART